MWKPVCGAGESQAVTRDPRARARPARLAHRQGAARGSCMSGPGCRPQPRRTVAFSAAARRSSTAGSALRHWHQRRSRGEYRQQAVGHPVDGVPLARRGTRSPAPMPSADARPRASASTSATVEPPARGAFPGTGVPRRELVAVQPDLRSRSRRRPQAAPGRPCRTRRATAPRSRPRPRPRGPGRRGRRCRATHAAEAGSATTSAPHHHAASSTAAVCQCAGSSTATGVPGSTSHSSRSRFAALAAQFAVVIADSSTRSPVASS